LRRLAKALIWLTAIALIAMFAFYASRNATHPLRLMESVDPLGADTAPKTSLSNLHDNMTLKVSVGGKITQMPLEDYVLGVLSAEMPASFEPEALMAQAVAARTFAVRRALYGGCPTVKGADVCDQSSCCEAYITVDAMKDKWKTGFDGYYAKLKLAVTQTAGKIITYQNQPIVALFHASSAGSTEDVEDVFSQALPYLRGVPSPDSEVTDLEQAEEYDRTSFCDTVNGAWPKAKLVSASLEKQISVASRFQSGRVDIVKLGGVSVEATDLRKLLDLKSTNFTVSFTQHSVVFTTEGSGHGVGMSQYGAQALAKEGKDYIEILKHYYTGVEITSMK